MLIIPKPERSLRKDRKQSNSFYLGGKKPEKINSQSFLYPIKPVSYVAPSAGKHIGITDELKVSGSRSLTKAMSWLKSKPSVLLYSG